MTAPTDWGASSNSWSPTSCSAPATEFQLYIYGALIGRLRSNTIQLDTSAALVNHTITATAENSKSDFSQAWVLDLRNRTDIGSIQIFFKEFDVEVLFYGLGASLNFPIEWCRFCRVVKCRKCDCHSVYWKHLASWNGIRFKVSIAEIYNGFQFLIHWVLGEHSWGAERYNYCAKPKSDESILFDYAWLLRKPLISRLDFGLPRS